MGKRDLFKRYTGITKIQELIQRRSNRSRLSQIQSGHDVLRQTLAATPSRAEGTGPQAVTDDTTRRASQDPLGTEATGTEDSLRQTVPEITSPPEGTGPERTEPASQGAEVDRDSRPGSRSNVIETLEIVGPETQEKEGTSGASSPHRSSAGIEPSLERQPEAEEQIPGDKSLDTRKRKEAEDIAEDVEIPEITQENAIELARRIIPEEGIVTSNNAEGIMRRIHDRSEEAKEAAEKIAKKTEEEIIKIIDGQKLDGQKLDAQKLKEESEKIAIRIAKRATQEAAKRMGAPKGETESAVEIAVEKAKEAINEIEEESKTIEDLPGIVKEVGKKAVKGSIKVLREKLIEAAVELAKEKEIIRIKEEKAESMAMVEGWAKDVAAERADPPDRAKDSPPLAEYSYEKARRDEEELLRYYATKVEHLYGVSDSPSGAAPSDEKKLRDYITELISNRQYSYEKARSDEEARSDRAKDGSEGGVRDPGYPENRFIHPLDQEPIRTRKPTWDPRDIYKPDPDKADDPGGPRRERVNRFYTESFDTMKYQIGRMSVLQGRPIYKKWVINNTSKGSELQNIELKAMNEYFNRRVNGIISGVEGDMKNESEEIARKAYETCINTYATEGSPEKAELVKRMNRYFIDRRKRAIKEVKIQIKDMNEKDGRLHYEKCIKTHSIEGSPEEAELIKGMNRHFIYRRNSALEEMKIQIKDMSAEKSRPFYEECIKTHSIEGTPEEAELIKEMNRYLMYKELNEHMEEEQRKHHL